MTSLIPTDPALGAGKSTAGSVARIVPVRADDEAAARAGTSECESLLQTRFEVAVAAVALTLFVVGLVSLALHHLL